MCCILSMLHSYTMPETTLEARAHALTELHSQVLLSMDLLASSYWFSHHVYVSDTAVTIKV